jgi:DNA-3-methyladenine glycosylase II
VLHAATPLEPVDRPLTEMPTHFAALATSITHQQVSMAAGRSIAQRTVEAAGGSWNPAGLLALSEDELRAAGLSRAKARYIRALAEADLRGELAGLEHEADDAVIERLVGLPGIGVWTAKMFLLFHLRRPDVFSGEDLGLRAGIRILDSLASPPSIREAEARAELWRPHRSVASLVLWDLVRRSRLPA